MLHASHVETAMRGYVYLVMILFYCHSANNNHCNITSTDEEIRVATFSKAAKQFCLQHQYNASTFFLADMSIHSGKKRFFVVDMNTDSIINSGLVSHGVCGIFFSATAGFSNESNSGCSSLGRYKIGNKYNGRFGTAYKLYGLDSSNSSAFKRNVVLHSYYEVPDTEIYPGHVCNSLGCPMVSVNFLKSLSQVIDKSHKPVLLWIVD